MFPGDETIAAVATPPGRGGLGLVRISGPDAAQIAAAVFRPGAGPAATFGHARAIFGVAVDPSGAPLDRGYLTFFHAPRSFTGQDTAEISIHGSPFLLGRLLDAAVEAGARPAEPGEFTFRAFRNGRVDLAQAEAVDDLISARTGHQARVAFEQAEGALSRRLAGPRAALVSIVARLEASLEFSEDEGTEMPGEDVARELEAIRGPLRDLAASYARGRVLRGGATVALAGAPNVGKSSLFNQLVGEPRAIVDELPGTTRDLVAESVEIAGVPVRLVDTAGLAEAPERIEAEGIRRAEEAVGEADLVLFVLDRSRPPRPDELARLGESSPATILVLNKSDLAASRRAEQLLAVNGRARPLEVSALTGGGVDALRDAIAMRLGPGPNGADVPLTRRRHHREVCRSLAGIERALACARSGSGEELILADLHEARAALGRLTGEVDLEEIYDRIFATFCIGK